MPIVSLDDSNRDDSYRVLAQAFRDDPMIRWLVDDPGRDEAMFRFVGAYHRAPGSSDLLLDDTGTAVGAAVWDPPGYRPSINRWTATFQALNVFRTRIRRGAIVDDMFPKLRPTEPHWYLSTIGAVEAGRGIGSTLLRHRLDQIDVPAYLESSNRANLPLYERFGFQVVDEVVLPMGGPPIWPMYRPAPADEVA
ncbi:putative N-acetyltransferase [Gordonia araii NBRC 100433]|uniref:Putative N-acetyltransferase n=1 Tax=Gordonia araii NBRC 100433 TaxID=1073574 RepID=G7GYX7_9ACTN|nr:GNAT family N-acetyltransferase [Gordonia araii]NNG97012.1 GNAT family N-acetyltransferase [Gordonia araii NBRC 100433]GAB08802.1 putative N-acetyltransferase [Gordonia araii NBRC 100433]